MIHDCFTNVSEQEVKACLHQMSQDPLWMAFLLDVAQQRANAHTYEKSHNCIQTQSTLKWKPTHTYSGHMGPGARSSQLAIRTRIMKLRIDWISIMKIRIDQYFEMKYGCRILREYGSQNTKNAGF